jgi:hypothetical protein
MLSEAAATKIAEWAHADASLGAQKQSDALAGALAIAPVGATTQVAAIRAVAALGCEHAILHDAALAALERVAVREEDAKVRDEALAALRQTRSARRWRPRMLTR